MVETQSVVTLHLAILLGLIFLAAGIGGLASPHDWPETAAELERSPGLTLALAFIALLFGAFVILVHRSWSDPLAIAVSLIGCASFAEGLILLGMPHRYLALVRPLLRHARAWAAFALVLGAWLLAAGLTGRALPLE